VAGDYEDQGKEKSDALSRKVGKTSSFRGETKGAEQEAEMITGEKSFQGCNFEGRVLKRKGGGVHQNRGTRGRKAGTADKKKRRILERKEA